MKKILYPLTFVAFSSICVDILQAGDDPLLSSCTISVLGDRFPSTVNAYEMLLPQTETAGPVSSSIPSASFPIEEDEDSDGPGRRQLQVKSHSDYRKFNIKNFIKNRKPPRPNARIIKKEPEREQKPERELSETEKKRHKINRLRAIIRKETGKLNKLELGIGVSGAKRRADFLIFREGISKRELNNVKMWRMKGQKRKQYGKVDRLIRKIEKMKSQSCFKNLMNNRKRPNPDVRIIDMGPMQRQDLLTKLKEAKKLRKMINANRAALRTEVNRLHKLEFGIASPNRAKFLISRDGISKRELNNVKMWRMEDQKREQCEKVDQLISDIEDLKKQKKALEFDY